MNGRKVAIVGSGNIGTDLMIKVMRLSKVLEMGAMIGIDPESDGLARARRLGVPVCDSGVEGFLETPDADEVVLAFDATSAGVHSRNDALLAARGIRVVDLTPAAIGPFVVPAVNLDEHIDAPNVNMVTCGGQATIPIVAAISRVAPVAYAEIVAAIASKSAGPGTRANIDEFTETTSRAIEQIGGAKHGVALKAKGPVDIFLPITNRDKLTAKIVYTGPVAAPVEQGQAIGALRVWIGDTLSQETPLFAAESVAVGTLPQRALDAIKELAVGWLR